MLFILILMVAGWLNGRPAVPGGEPPALRATQPAGAVAMAADIPAVEPRLVKTSAPAKAGLQLRQGETVFSTSTMASGISRAR